MTFFSDLGLADPLLKSLAAEGYDTPTPIQVQAIPPVLDGRDLLGIAQTGTGKTAAFALPSLQRLTAKSKARPTGACRMLVLAPTRELAGQIATSFKTYGQFLRVVVETAYGGVPIGRQVRALQPGVDVLVATPGRLLDLIDGGALTLRHVEVLVLDEADQMMDLGFIHALKRIVGMLPKTRQTLFFSATMPKAIAELADKYLTNPVKVSVAPVATTAERVDQSVTHVNAGEKQALLTILLSDAKMERALVFTRTKHGADRVVRHLVAAGIMADAIHGNKSQPQRERALAFFKAGKSRVLVATDIAARGIDIDAVSHVINFELPNVPEQYVHRIGRTARAGAGGEAISFCASDERPYLKDIEKLTRQTIEVRPLPAGFVAAAAKLPKPTSAEPAYRDPRAPGGGRGDPGRGAGQPRHAGGGGKPGGFGGGGGGAGGARRKPQAGVRVTSTSAPRGR